MTPGEIDSRRQPMTFSKETPNPFSFFLMFEVPCDTTSLTHDDTRHQHEKNVRVSRLQYLRWRPELVLPPFQPCSSEIVVLKL